MWILVGVWPPWERQRRQMRCKVLSGDILLGGSWVGMYPSQIEPRGDCSLCGSGGVFIMH